MKITSSSPFTLPDGAPAMALRFCAIMAGLGALVARRFVRMPHLVRFTMLLWSRLNRAVPRLARALTRAGKGPAIRARGDRADAARVRPPGLPSGRGWLLRALGWEAAAYRGHLEAMLAEPAMQAALAGVPAVGRILRPICRMLGVEAAGLGLPKIIRPAAVAPVVMARPARAAIWPRKGVPQLPKGAWFAPPVKNWA